MSLTGSMISDEILKAHRAAWYVWSGGVKMRRTAKMMGSWGYDVTCSCGWESKTGGATRTSVEDAFFDHRLDAQIDAEVLGLHCTCCGAVPGQACTDPYTKRPLDYQHAERILALP